MALSHFGKKLTGDAGIVNLMEDLGHALNVNPDILFLGGGNPAHIPAFEDEVARHLSAIAKDPERLHKLVGVYQSPRGSETFIDTLVSYINRHFDWGISARNVAITNGSQSAFFILINLLSGTGSEHKKQIVFPMMPEYLGYADQSSEHETFRSFLPKIEMTAPKRFKYHVDFSAFSLAGSDAALCVSRPTNPTGNVLSADEMTQLAALAKQAGLPFIIDCAYGEPFPGLVYNDDQLAYNPDNVYVLSCSKLGLPGVRTGVVIGPEALVEQVIKVNTVISLANGNFGPSLVDSMMAKGDLHAICQNTLLPFYRQRRDFAVSCVEKYLGDLPVYLHEPEGAFFLWLWFRDLPVSSTELYERLKARGVLVMDGSHFFFGLEQSFEHARQCIRLTYCQSEAVIEQAMAVIAEVVREC